MSEQAIQVHSAEAPAWLPEMLVQPWDFFAAYPPVLALIVLMVGLGLAIIGRLVVLRWGSKLTSGEADGLDTRLLSCSTSTTLSGQRQLKWPVGECF